MSIRCRTLLDKDRIAMSQVLAAAFKRCSLVLGLIATCLSLPGASAAPARPETFASPEQAADALAAAARKDDAPALLEIFGSAGRRLVLSGDVVADKEARARFVEHYAEGNKILHEGEAKATLVIGSEEWPFPIPLVRQGSAWHFDARAGEEEILDRRIGRNELDAIEVCRAYVQAQREYAADRAGDREPVEYAQKFVSSPGRHDGLYWPVGPGDKESPIGPQMAKARAEGYGAGSPRSKTRRAPYHGYYYKILTRQGPAASGGARNYVVDGHMRDGFALVAFPAKYGDSGVTTFLIDQDGIVYQKDLGPRTAAIAGAIAEFDPDLTWKTRQ